MELITGNEKIVSEKDKKREPITKEYPSNCLKTNVPVIFVSGMAAGWEQIDEPLHILSEQGRRVVGIVHPKKISFHSEYANYPPIQREKANRVQETIMGSGSEEVDLVAMSEGALNAVYAAFLNPEKVRSLVLINPAGIPPEEKKFIWTRLSDLKKGVKKELRKAIKEGGDVFEKIKALQKRSEDLRKGSTLPENIERKTVALLEAASIATASILLMLKFLKDKGVDVAILQGEHDEIFSLDNLRKNLGEDMADEIYTIEGGHYDLITKPKKIMPKVESILSAHESKLHVDESKEVNAWLVNHDKYGELGMVRELPTSRHRTFKDGVETTQQTAENRFRAFLPNGRRTPKIYETLGDAANDLRRIAKESANS